MAGMAGVDLPREKSRSQVNLYLWNRSFLSKNIEDAGVDLNTRVKDLTEPNY